jgi:hypothetical protein
MDIKLDRKDLFNLLYSVRPEGALQHRCEDKRYGIEEYGQWRWKSEIEGLSEEQLWDLYDQCKNFVIYQKL